MSENGSPNVQQKPEEGAPSEHLNIKVTDNNNEVFFKIKRTTALGKLMNAFCDRQGKNISSVRFLFDGQRVTATDNPDTVRAAQSQRIYRGV
jgi:small ubiquitin-related modifier